MFLSKIIYALRGGDARIINAAMGRGRLLEVTCISPGRMMCGLGNDDDISVDLEGLHELLLRRREEIEAVEVWETCSCWADGARINPVAIEIKTKLPDVVVRRVTRTQRMGSGLAFSTHLVR